MILNQLDEDSKRNHIRNDLDKNLFIEAGAGAGKTSLLVDRVTNLLQKPGVKPEEVVVITFTNAAAGELYERVAGKLRTKAEEADTSEQIREAYAHLDRIHISTIHHFCHEILSQRTFDANLVLDLQMEEADDTIEREDRFLDDYMASSTGTELRDIRAAFGLNYASCIRDTFHRLADRKYAKHIYDEKLAGVSADTMRSRAYDICRSIDSAITEALAELAEEGIIPPFTNSQGGAEAYKTLKRALNRYRSGMNKDMVFNAWRFFNRSAPQLFGLKGFKGNERERIKKADAAVIATAREQLASWLPEFEEWKADRVLKYVLGAAEVYQKQPESKYISNDRLLYETRDLLKNEEARRYLKKRYRYLFVDEYQDTDDMQTQIIWDLAMDEENHEKLRDGALVVVGDPKQAIYRFRGADSTLFEKTRQRMQDLPNVLDVTLQNNYRSSGSIIGWVNKRFGDMWKDAKLPYGSAYTDMLEGPERHAFGCEESEGSFLCGVYYCGTGKTKDKPKDKGTLVDLIRSLTDGTHQIAVKNNRTNSFERKTVGYEDILVLTWYMTDIPLYVKAFKDEGIPANVYGAITFEETYIRRFAALLSYLADPENWNAFANAKQALAHKDLDQMGSEAHTAAGEMLRNIRKKVTGMAPKAVLHFLEAHQEYWLDWDVDISANDLYNAQKSVINMVEQIDASDNNTLAEIAAFVNRYIDEKHEREAEISADVKQVRLMNVHKAKGLEGHIVIIADRDNIKRYPASYKDDRKFYEVVSYTDIDGATPQIFKTFSRNEEICKKADAASQLDQERLEYVAATRAAEVLIFMGQGEGDKDCPFSDVTADSLPDIYSVLEGKQEEDTVPSIIRDFRPLADDEPVGDGTPVFIIMNPSRLASEDDTDYDTDSGADSGTSTNHPSGKTSGADRPVGNVFGTVMHRCFELMVMRRERIFHENSGKQESEISKLIRQAMLESNQDVHEDEKVSYAHFLMGVMKAFLANDGMISAIDEAGEVHTEMGFSYIVDASSELEFIRDISPFVKGNDLNNSRVWVNGTADLVLISKDGRIRIIDYKSNARGSMPAEEFRKRMNEKYAGQLLMYRYAMARLYNTDLSGVSAELYLIDDAAGNGK